MLSMVIKDLLLQMPTAAAKCLKSTFTLSAAITTITQPQGHTRHLKISNIRQVRLLKIIRQKLTITEVQTELFATIYKI